MPLFPTLVRQKQVDLYEFQSSLVFWDSQHYTEEPCLNNES